MRIVYLAFLISVWGISHSYAQDLNWRRYNLYGTATSVEIPLALFTEDAGPPENGQGRMFRSSDGLADLSVYSMRNSGEGPAEFLRTHFPLPKRAIVYRRVTGSMVTVSGYREDKIWYARCNFAVNELKCVSLNYPAREKTRWDSVVTRISHSLS